MHSLQQQQAAVTPTPPAFVNPCRPWPTTTTTSTTNTRISPPPHTHPHTPPTPPPPQKTHLQTHSQGIIYRDVKPDNFLFLTTEPDSPLKATDFGLSIRHASHEPKLTSRSGNYGV